MDVRCLLIHALPKRKPKKRSFKLVCVCVCVCLFCLTPHSHKLHVFLENLQTHLPPKFPTHQGPELPKKQKKKTAKLNAPPNTGGYGCGQHMVRFYSPSPSRTWTVEWKPPRGGLHGFFVGRRNAEYCCRLSILCVIHNLHCTHIKNPPKNIYSNIFYI